RELECDSGGTAGGPVRTETRQTSGDRKAGGRDEEARRADGDRSLRPAGGAAGSAEDLGANLLGLELRVSTTAFSASGGGGGTGISRTGIWLGRGHRSGKVLRPGPSRPAHGPSGNEGQGQANADPDPEVPDGRSAGRGAGQSER